MRDAMRALPLLLTVLSRERTANRQMMMRPRERDIWPRTTTPIVIPNFFEIGSPVTYVNLYKPLTVGFD